MSYCSGCEIRHCCFTVGKTFGYSATLENIETDHGNNFNLGRMLNDVVEKIPVEYNTRCSEIGFI